jgi:HprK-related kinase A
VKVADLSRAEFAADLATDGLIVQLGPFAVRLRITEPTLIPPLHELFAYYPVCAPERTIVAFEISLRRERRAADLFRPGFACRLDGKLEARDLSLPLALPTLEWTINWGIGTTVGQFMMLHAAVVERNGAALVMPGAPGSGKSTLCAALVGRGWRLFSDEFALIVPQTGLLVAMPRPISLKNRSIDLIRAAAPHLRFGPRIHGTTKGSVAHLRPPPDSVLRAGEPAVPRWIVFPKWQKDAEAVLERLDDVTFFSNLTHDSINYDMMGELGFQTLARLVGGCAGYRLGFDSLEDGVRLVEGLGDRARLEERPSDHVPAG